MPNPIEIIKEDHAKVKKLFQEYATLDAEDEKGKSECAHDILKALTVHAKMEEKYFYPRLKEVISADHPIAVDEALAEHHAAKLLITELKAMPVSSEAYDAKMDVLEENVLHHVEEEETDLLPEAETLLAEKLDDIGKEMQEYKDNAEKSLLDKLLGE